jgi:hypothetical protein
MAETLKEKMDREASGKMLIHLFIADQNGPFVSGRWSRIRGRFGIACDLKKSRMGKMEQFTVEAHAVNCPECMKHQKYAENYQPAPKIEKYEDIPECVRKILEDYEKAAQSAPAI